MLGQIFTHWHCLQHVGTHGFCRGRRVCPTEAIKNHPEKKSPKIGKNSIRKICSKPFQHIQTKEYWPSMFCKHDVHFPHTSFSVFFCRGFAAIGVVGFLDWRKWLEICACLPCHQAGFHKWLSYNSTRGEPTNHPNYSVDFRNDGALFFWTVPKARSTSPGTSTRGHHFFGATWCPFGAMLRTFTASCGLRS